MVICSRDLLNGSTSGHIPSIVELRKNVNLGNDWLIREKGEDWHQHIVVEKIDLECPKMCVLGQTFGWINGVERIYSTTTASVNRLGFSSLHIEDYATLEMLWKELINAAR